MVSIAPVKVSCSRRGAPLSLSRSTGFADVFRHGLEKPRGPGVGIDADVHRSDAQLGVAGLDQRFHAVGKARVDVEPLAGLS